MPVSVVTQPTVRNALEELQSGFEAGAMVTVVGRCEVRYDGRASSYLGPGERLVIVKPDGAVLVHRNEQRTPVNWQPPGCTHDVSIENEQLLLQSERSTPHEKLDIVFESIAQVSILELDDPPELSLEGSEEHLRQRILEDPELLEAEFTPLATERETSAGAVDIYGKDSSGTPTVVELKRRRVGPDAVSQLKRYVDALERDLPVGRSVRGILVAPSVTERAERLLANEELDFVSLIPTHSSRTSTMLSDFTDK